MIDILDYICAQERAKELYFDVKTDVERSYFCAECGFEASTVNVDLATIKCPQCGNLSLFTVSPEGATALYRLCEKMIGKLTSEKRKVFYAQLLKETR